MTKLLVKQTNEFNGQLEIAVGIVITFLTSLLTGLLVDHVSVKMLAQWPAVL